MRTSNLKNKRYLGEKLGEGTPERGHSKNKGRLRRNSMIGTRKGKQFYAT